MTISVILGSNTFDTLRLAGADAGVILGRLDVSPGGCEDVCSGESQVSIYERRHCSSYQRRQMVITSAWELVASAQPATQPRLLNYQHLNALTSCQIKCQRFYSGNRMKMISKQKDDGSQEGLCFADCALACLYL